MTRLGQHDRAADAMERIYREWDEAMGARDVGAALELYAPDATIESPLVSICSEGKLESTGVTTTCGTLSPSSFSGHRRKGAGIALVFSRTDISSPGNIPVRRPIATRWISSR